VTVGICLSLVACSQTSGTDPTVTLRGLRTIDVSPPSTLVAPTNTSATVGYVALVVDGATFDLFRPGVEAKRFVIPDIQVPPVGSCEGDLSRALLASMIHGKQVRIDPDGTVWRIDDVNVGLTMVLYGYAHSTTLYAAEDANSVDIDCANTTTSTTMRPIVIVQQPRPRATTPPTETVVEETTPVTEPAPEETAPPPARPEPPRETEPERPKETKPPDTEPEDTVDRTPRPPKTPKLPDDSVVG
jgi:hypothetical protein